MTTKQPYKQHIKSLAHLHADTVTQIAAPDFYFYDPKWPDFVLKASEQYGKPPTKIVDDLISYRNSFPFQRDKSAYAAGGAL